jgi:THO complex subunit 1
MAGYGVPVVGEAGVILQEMLEQAQTVKQTHTIEPPLHKSDLAELFERVDSAFAGLHFPESKKHILDTAVRDIFNNLLVSRA